MRVVGRHCFENSLSAGLARERSLRQSNRSQDTPSVQRSYLRPPVAAGRKEELHTCPQGSSPARFYISETIAGPTSPLLKHIPAWPQTLLLELFSSLSTTVSVGNDELPAPSALNEPMWDVYGEMTNMYRLHPNSSTCSVHRSQCRQDASYKDHADRYSDEKVRHHRGEKKAAASFHRI